MTDGRREPGAGPPSPTVDAWAAPKALPAPRPPRPPRPPRRPRRPRRSLQVRLMLLYAVPFLVSGTVLLAGALAGTRVTVPAGSAPETRPDTTTHFPVVTWAVCVAVLVALSFGLGWLVTARFLRPLRTITATARDISASNLHRRLGPTGRADEFAELAATLDDLFARLEAAFASQRRFVAHASHELRTPLTAQRAVLQVALADPDATDDELRAACREVLGLGTAQERLIDALLTLASGEQGVERRECFDLADVARRVLAGRPLAGTAGTAGAGADVTVAAALETAPAAGDPRLVESLVANLVDNATRHNVPGGRVEVLTAATADGARLSVRNSGPVVPPAQLGRLFEPFQQLDGRRIRHGTGHGLGLAIVRAIADAHGARLAATARPTGGLDVEVTFR